MPLKKGSSKKVFNQNVEELMKAWENTGKIGNSRPKTKAKALKQALAIAYQKRRERH